MDRQRSTNLAEEIRRSVGVLHREGADVVELRLLGKRRNYAGYFDDFDKLADEAAEADEKGYDVYVTLNPCEKALLGRADNETLEADKRFSSTSDCDIQLRRSVLLDFDAQRPSKVSATEEEKERAIEKARAAKGWLKELGFRSLALFDSGNGAHVIVPIDLPNDAESGGLVKRFTEAVAFRFSDEAVKIDAGTWNASRLTKAYGVFARKGRSVERIGRGHRRSGMIEAPESREPNDALLLEAVAELLPKPDDFVKEPGGFDLRRWIEEQGIEAECRGEWSGGPLLWKLSHCPFCGTADGNPFIAVKNTGQIAAGCHHQNTCSDWKWRDLRELFEPGVYDRNGTREYGEYDGKSASYSRDERGYRNEYDDYYEYDDFGVLPEAKQFPVDALPEPCAKLVDAGTRSLDCPPELIGVPMLAVLSSAIGISREAEIKPGWREGATLYLKVVAHTGSKKTPAAKIARGPVFAVERELKANYQKAKEEHEEKMRDWETKKRQAVKDNETIPEKEPPPIMKRAAISDATIEAVVVRLAENPRGLLNYNDELSGWARSLDQYKGGKGNDRQHILSLWSNDPITVDRKGAPDPIMITRPFMALCGGIQPDILSEIHDGREDGLLDRFLTAFPDTSRVPRYVEHGVKPETTKNYEKLYRALRDLDCYAHEVTADPVPGVVRFSEGAHRYLVRAVNRLAEQVERPGFPPRLRGVWSKLEAYLCRLALILALSRIVWAREQGRKDAAEIIEVGDVANAAKLVGYFQAHARRVMARVHGEDPLDKLAEDLAGFLEKRGRTFKGTPTELAEAFESEHKSAHLQTFTKRLRIVVARSLALSLEEAKENYQKPDGTRSTRNTITLTLQDHRIHHIHRNHADNSGNSGEYDEESPSYSSYPDDGPEFEEGRVASNGKRRLTMEEAQKVQRLINEGMKPDLARAAVIGEDA